MISNLLDRMKLPFRKNKEFLSALYDILGFYPHNIEVYRIAFSHKSICYTYDKEKKLHRKSSKPRSDYTARPLNNERLEFLGDAVIETVVSDILFRHFEHKREGFLTSTRSKIVQREALNRLANDMGLDRLIHAAQGTDTSHTNIGGNAFEALMGAIYLDRGYKHCHWFIANRVIGHYVDIDNVAQKEVNFKSKLLEWSQKNRININFRDFSRKNEGKGFGTVLTVEGITVSRGEGRSKKESQQDAAKEALTRMRRDEKFYDSLFRAKEKRTAMEAEESFALPKIEEIEEEIAKPAQKAKSKKAPVLEERKKPSNEKLSEEAYDAAYDENANFEVIDTPPEEPLLTAADYAAKGLPAPPDANDIEDDEQKEQRQRNRKEKHDESRQNPASAESGNGKEALSPKPQKQESSKADNPTKEKEDKAAKKSPTANSTSRRGKDFANGFVILEDIHDVPMKDKEENEAHDDKKEKHATAEKGTSDKPVEQTEEPIQGPSIHNDAPEAAKDVEEEAPEQEETPIETPLEEPAQEKSAQEEFSAIQEPQSTTDSPATSFTDDSDFEIYEVDNLPDITGNNEPEEETPEATSETAEEEHEEEEDNVEENVEEQVVVEDDEEEEEEQEAPSRPMSEPTVRPQLRHISLDDFVFGIDPSENEPLDDELEQISDLPAKPQKPRRRKRKPAAPLNEEEQHDNMTDNADSKPKKRRNNRSQAKKRNDEHNGNAEETEKDGGKSKKSRAPRRQHAPAKEDTSEA